jgi:molybdopterin-binding protein
VVLLIRDKKINQALYAGKEKKVDISARNVLKGKVVRVVRGAVNSEVTIELPGGTEIVSIITNHSVDTLNLEAGKEAFAVIKASNVMVAID